MIFFKKYWYGDVLKNILNFFWDNNILDWPKLTCWIYNSDYKTLITLQKANLNKLLRLIINQLNVIICVMRLRWIHTKIKQNIKPHFQQI
jgi:hypothetical protein